MMEKTKIEEVIETTENKSGFFKVAAGIGLAALGSIIAYKYVVKPIIAKIKAQKEQIEVIEEDE